MTADWRRTVLGTIAAALAFTVLPAATASASPPASAHASVSTSAAASASASASATPSTAAPSSVSASVDRGPRAGITPRIINGRGPSAGEFGFLVALGSAAAYAGGSFYDAQFCGGSLVTESLVVTAAHCVVDQGRVLRPDEILVATGTSLDAPAAVVAVAGVAVHPGFDERTMAPDVAVVALATPLVGVPTIPVVSAAEAAVVAAPGAPAATAGWGATRTDGSGFPVAFQVADLTFFPDAACLPDGRYQVGGVTFRGLQGVDLRWMLCAAGAVDTVVLDSCQGDSGGPLVGGSGPNARLVGVVSWGDGCAFSSPGIYTRLAAVTDWLAAAGVPVTPGAVPPTVTDTTAPVVQALRSRGWRGWRARLRFRIDEASRRTTDTVLMRDAAGSVVRRVSTELGRAVPGVTYYVSVKVPRWYRGGSFCVQSTDPYGNTSPASCARLLVR